MTLRHYLLEAFEPTILFGFFSSLVGVAAAHHFGAVNNTMAALAIVGVVVSQIAVNLIDDYVDYSSGLDKETVKTKFSGGSPLVAGGLVKPVNVLAMGIVAFLIAAAIGVYLIANNPTLLPFALVGGITVLFYAKYLVKVPYLSEFITALNFALIVLGSFIAAGGSIGRLPLVAFAAIAAGLQVGVAVLVNYVPDIRADRKYGRRSGVIMIKSNRGRSAFYLALEAVSFIFVVAGVSVGALPVGSLIVLLAIPSAMAISCGIASYKNPRSYEKVMANAAMMELVFILLLAIAFV